MAYDPVTDFLALIRQTASGAQIANIPGLDYVLAAMSRAGLITLFTSQSEPTVNQATTAWLKPASPSWTSEGTLFLWNSSTAAYELATPALWAALFAGGSPYVFQSAAAASNVIAPETTLLAVQKTAPATTTLTLPPIANRLGQKLQIVDWSDGVVTHAITLLPSGVGTTVMKRNSWLLVSTADQLSGVTLQPSSDLNAWIIAP